MFTENITKAILVGPDVELRTDTMVEVSGWGGTVKKILYNYYTNLQASQHSYSNRHLKSFTK